MGFASCFLSLLVHISLVLITLYAPWQGGEIQLDLDKPVYEVELVRLPEQKEPVQVPSSKASGREEVKPKQAQKQAKALPKQQSKAQPAPTPAPKSDPVQIAKQKKKPQEVKTREKEEAKPKQRRETPSQEEVKTPEGVMQEAMQDISDQAEQEAETDEQALARELAQLRQETEAQGVDLESLGRSSSAGATESLYGNLIKKRIRSNWRFPDLGGDDDLQATVKLRISSQGDITEHSLVRSSGNSQFDSSVLRAIARTGSLQAPPNPELKTIRIDFHLQEMSR